MKPNDHNRAGPRLRRGGKTALLAFGAMGLLATLPDGASAQERSGHSFGGSFGQIVKHSWPFWGGDLSNTHAGSMDDGINPFNAGSLKTKWVFTTAGDVTATPTVEDGSVYVPDWGGYIYRIDAATGSAIWSHKLSEYTGNAQSFSRNSPAIGPRSIVFGDQAAAVVMAVDKATGALLWKTNVDTSLGAFITGSATIVNGRVYVGVSSAQEYLSTQPGFAVTFRGSMVALDLRTGHILWQTYTVPTGYTGGAVWSSSPAIDLSRNLLYTTTGNNYSVPSSVTTCLTNAGTNVTAQLACLDPTDNMDSTLALDLTTGKVKWAHRFEGSDQYLSTCSIKDTGGVPCPSPQGPDYDFGDGAHIIRTEVDGKPVEEIGAGQKSGVYWAMNPDTGALLWETQAGPGGGTGGGIEWGSSTDNDRVYVAEANSEYQSYLLNPGDTQTWNGASWSALDARTGDILWRVPVPGQDPLTPTLPVWATGQVTVANGVFYGGTLAGDMVALDARTGKLLWKFASGGSVIGGPSIVDGTIYWGSGYSRQTLGRIGNNKLYAFTVPGWSWR